MQKSLIYNLTLKEWSTFIIVLILDCYSEYVVHMERRAGLYNYHGLHDKVPNSPKDKYQTQIQFLFMLLIHESLANG